jgi:hypothetical protein
MNVVKIPPNNFDAIYGRAFEKFLLELARGYAAEQERLQVESRGKPNNPEIREIQLKGEYPNTGFQIRRYDRVRDLEQEQWYFIWGNPEFFDRNRKPLCSADRMVGDTLMWARGG